MKIPVLFVVLTIVGNSNVLVGGESDRKQVGDPLVTISVSNAPLRDAVLKLAMHALPLGTTINFEESRKSLPPYKSRVTVDLQSVTITNALMKLFQNDRQYSWETTQQVINVFAPEDRRDTKNVLNQILPELVIQNKNRYEIVSLVLSECNRITSGKYKLSKDGDVIDQLLVFRMPYKELKMAEPVLRKHSFSFRNMSVREILNVVSLEAGVSWATFIVDGNPKISLLQFSLGPEERHRDMTIK